MDHQAGPPPTTPPPTDGPGSPPRGAGPGAPHPTIRPATAPAADHRAPDGRVPDRRALAAAAVTVLLWASAFVSIRAAAPHYAPGALALGRLLTASLALAAVLAVKRVPLPPRQAWPGILTSGVLWFGLYMVALNWGEQGVDAGTAAMVVNIGPLVIALLSGWLLKEGFPPMLLAGMAVSFTGAVVVGLSTSDGGGASLGGVLLCLLAALAYGAGVVAQKPALTHATPLQVTSYGCFVGTAVTLPFAWQLLTRLPEAPLTATLNMVYLGLFPTALAFSTWTYALSRTTAGRMGATTYAVPALVVLIAWPVLGEVPAALTLLGGAICLAGVALSRRRPAPGRGPGPHLFHPSHPSHPYDGPMASIRQVQITFDCANPERVARFWCEVLGYVVPPPPEGYASWDDFDRALPPDRQGSAFACVDPTGAGPRLFFQRVPEGKTVKNRLHLDVRVATGLVGEERLAALEAECTRLTALGATRVRLLPADDHNESCLVMQDVEGNEFCLD